MSNRNRLQRLALAGCLSAALYTLATSHGVTVAHAFGHHPDTKTSHDHSDSQPNTDQISAPAVHSQKTAGYNRQKACDNPQSTDEADLCQQWRMANATEELVALTNSQFWVLVFTLVFTAGAAIAAGFAACYAKSIVSVTRDTAIRQLRAYVSIAGTKVEWKSGHYLEITVSIKNTGQTPAYGIRHATEVAVGEPENFDLPDEPDTPPKFSDLGGGMLMDWPAPAGPLSDENWEGVRNRSIPLYVFGEIRYGDAFRKVPRYTRYRMRIGENLYQLTPMADGNESN